MQQRQGRVCTERRARSAGCRYMSGGNAAPPRSDRGPGFLSLVRAMGGGGRERMQYPGWATGGEGGTPAGFNDVR